MAYCSSYEFGGSGFYLGSCYRWLPLILPGSISFVLTDPPYEVSRDNNFHTMGRLGVDFGEWDHKFDQTRWLWWAVRALKPGGSIVIWNDWKKLGRIADALEELGCVVKDPLRWRKTNPMPRNRDRRYVPDCEMAVWAVKPKSKWTFNRREENPYERPEFHHATQRHWHPTRKPFDLFYELIEIHTDVGDIILDPFAGSMTTAQAAWVLGRRSICIERDREYFGQAIDDLAEQIAEGSPYRDAYIPVLSSSHPNHFTGGF